METTSSSTGPAGTTRKTVYQNINRSPLFRGLTPDGKRAYAQEALDQAYLVRQLAAVRNGLPDTGQRNVIEDVKMDVEAVTAANSSTSHTEASINTTATTTNAEPEPQAGPTTFEPEPLPPLWPVIRNILLLFAITVALTWGAFKLWNWWYPPTTLVEAPCVICETDDDLDAYIRSLDLEPVSANDSLDWNYNE